MPLPQKYRDLFRLTNYKFSTSEGDRLTSLYFEDCRGNQGRWRRQHRDGRLLIFQGQSLRLFVHPLQVGAFLEEGTAMAMNRYEKTRYKIGDYLGKYSLTPRDGWSVVEILPQCMSDMSYARQFGHGSGGHVMLNDPSVPAADFASLAAYGDDELSDWTA